MAWLDQIMDRLTRRGTKVVATGHPPGDTTPSTGSRELSEELEADYGPDSPAAEPPAAEDGPDPGDADSSAP